MEKPSLSVIIPACNAAHCLDGTLARIRRYCEERGDPFEVIVVDDGSTDKTGSIADAHRREDPRVRSITFSRNRGKGAAVRAGMLAARGEVLLFTDADGATDTSYLAAARQKMRGGADVVIASRSARDAPGAGQAVPQPVLRRLAGTAGNLVIRAMGVRGIHDTQCGFKLFRAEAARRLFSASRIDGFAFDVEVLLLARRMGLRVEIIPVQWRHNPVSAVTPASYLKTLGELAKLWWARSRKACGMAGVLLVAVIFCAAALHSVRDEGLVIDELAHVPAGFLNLKYQEFTLNPEHPPLMKIIAAIPLLFADIPGPRPSAASADQWGEGERFFFADGRDADAILLAARTSVILFCTLCLAAIGLVLLRMLSPPWAVAALVLVAFEPNLFAHARYVTTDAGVAFTSLIALLLFSLFCRRPTCPLAVMLGTALGAALLAKFSGLFTCAFVWAACAIVCARRFFRREGMRQLVPQVLLIVLLPIVITYAVYFFASFRSDGTRLKEMAAAAVEDPGVRETLSAATASVWTRPVALYGIGMENVRNRSGEDEKHRFPQYLDGEFRAGRGWRSYFPRALLYKATPSLLALSAAAFVLLACRLVRRETVDFPIVLTGGYLLSYLGVSMASDLNIGIRHISPVLICLPVFAVLVLATEKRRPSFWKGAAGLAVAGGIASFVLISPVPLAYFNRIAGGPENGVRHLIDSNLDWGNNLKRLFLWAERNGVGEMAVDYWGKTPLDHYDGGRIFREWHVDSGTPHGWFAVAPMWIVHSRWTKQEGKMGVDYGYLEGLEPVARIGYGINVYELP